MRRIAMPLVLVSSAVVVVVVLALAVFAGPTISLAQGDSHYFPETKHTVQGKFWQYWQSHGGLAQQGYPISDEFQERSDLNGKTYTVQYFERAVFEFHPENAGTQYEVLLSQLGTFRYHDKYGSPAGQPQAGDVGIAAGQNAIEFIAQSSQNGRTFANYGYLTHISGLPDELLFTDPANRSEATAKFTFSGTAQSTVRIVVSQTLHMNTLTGDLNIYLNNTPAGDFNNPSSFSSGTLIATYSTRAQSILTVIAPNQGLFTVYSDLTQTVANTFQLGNQQHRLGHPNLAARDTYMGQAMRTEPTAPLAVEYGAGNIVPVPGGQSSP